MSTSTAEPVRASTWPGVGTDEVVSPPPGHPRFPLLDSLRALAAVGVLLAHVAIFSGQAQRLGWGAGLANLFTGVTVFFVLSGFLLFRPFFNSEMSAAPSPRMRDFARRRFLRIVPAYWLALTILAVYPGVPGVFTSHWWRYYGFVQFYFPRSTSTQGLGIAWTLCVEVAFYAMLPVYVAVTRRVTRTYTPAHRVRFHLFLLAVLAVASIAVRIPFQSAVMQNSLPAHFLWFAIGMALAVLSVAYQDERLLPRAMKLVTARPGWCWVSAGVVYLIMCVILTSAPGHLFYSASQAFWQYTLSGLVAALIVMPAVFGQRQGGTPRRILSLRWLAWLGIISYGIYLWHATIAITLVAHGVRSWWLLLITDLALATTVAAGSYYLLERPILRLKRRGSARAV